MRWPGLRDNITDIHNNVIFKLLIYCFYYFYYYQYYLVRWAVKG